MVMACSDLKKEVLQFPIGTDADEITCSERE